MSVVVRYFPWAPKIPWRVHKGKYLIPQLTNAIWSRVIETHNPVVVANGGLLEAYYSLIYLELLNSTFPLKSRYWSGPKKFQPLIKLNGLAHLTDSIISDSVLERFPTPIFMDTVGNTYLNCMHSYMSYRSIYGGPDRRRYQSLVEQLIQNSCQEWCEHYTPLMRNWNVIPDQISQWAKINRFDLNKPYVFIAPDQGLSIHKKSALGWGEMELKSLSAMLMQSGIQTVVFTDRIRKTHTSQAWFIKSNLEWMIFFATYAKVIMADEIDFLLMAPLLNPRAKVIGKLFKSPWSLSGNAKFFGLKDVIYENRELTPYKVFQEVTESNGR